VILSAIDAEQGLEPGSLEQDESLPWLYPAAKMRVYPANTSLNVREFSKGDA